jgi:hypothetical protein
MDDFDMQPLNKVNPNAITSWGVDDAMLSRPHLAAKIAQYISQWSDIETLLGLFLAILLHAHEEAALAIFHGIENRTAQFKMLTSAAQASLPPETFDAVSALLAAVIKPAMKFRDKLAHWSWGISGDLPDALVLCEPKDKLRAHLEILRIQTSTQTSRTPDVPMGNQGVYVLREKDLDAALSSLLKARDSLSTAMGACWQSNPPALRARNLAQLSSEPSIRNALARRKGNPESPQRD